MTRMITSEPASAERALPAPGEALRRLRRILVPVDGSAFAEHALAWAIELAHHADAAIDLAYVNVLPADIVLGDPGIAGQWELNAIGQADAYLDGLADRIRTTEHIELTTTVERDTSAARALVRIARSRGSSLAVMATHGRSGAARAWLGSVAESFVRESPVPVMLIRGSDDAAPVERTDRLFRRVLVAMDGSRNAEAAFDVALVLAGFAGADIELLRVVDPLPLAAGTILTDALESRALDIETRRAAADLDRHLSATYAEGLEATSSVVIHATPAHAILAHAERIDADLLVLGTRGRKGVGRVLLGSVAEGVVRGTTRPVVVVPHAADYGAR